VRFPPLRWNRKEFVPVWIAAAVGVHLVPLAPLLHYPLPYPVATFVTIVALVAVPVARRVRSRSVPSTG
jgi:hypothetical protein